MTDFVNSPKHYVIKPGLEVIDVREALLKKMHEAHLSIPYEDIDDWSRAWEYITRAFFKNNLEDFQKGGYYLNRLIKRLEERRDERLRQAKT